MLPLLERVVRFLCESLYKSYYIRTGILSVLIAEASSFGVGCKFSQYSIRSLTDLRNCFSHIRTGILSVLIAEASSFGAGRSFSL